MTDKKQIIIDGVDVRNCDSFIDYYMVDETQFQDVPEDIIEQDKLPVVYKGLPDCLLRKNLCGAYTCHCKDKPNCYFKQLARKTQELEQYKASKQASYEALQKQCNELELQNRKLKQECEELKNYIQEREVWGDQCEFCKHNDKENCHQNIILDNLKTINSYHKALDKIETATKINCEEICGRKFTDCKDTSCFSVNILDIINKAKGK